MWYGQRWVCDWCQCCNLLRRRQCHSRCGDPQATDPTANKLYRTVAPFAVQSEATGKDYSVQCRLGSDLQTMTCEDAIGGTAEARLIRNGDPWTNYLTLH